MLILGGILTYVMVYVHAKSMFRYIYFFDERINKDKDLHFSSSHFNSLWLPLQHVCVLFVRMIKHFL